MAKVVWTRGALAELEAIRAYIGQFNPLAAQRMAARLFGAAEKLAATPQIGRRISLDRRELTIIPPYLIRYLVDGDIVRILEVRHGAREPE